MNEKKFLVFPSTKMLPMEDVAKELKIIHGFATTNQNAKDTDLVAGTPSDLIAVVALDEDGNPIEYTDSTTNEVVIKKRESVKNALNLAGLPASAYLTKEEGSSIQNFGENVARTYSDEIAALRDELYQIRGELTRNGFINEYGLYAGFQEFFRTSDKKYMHIKLQQGNEIIESIELCAVSTSTANSTNINKVIPTQTGIIKKDDWFIITDKTADISYLVKATLIETANNQEEITFESLISKAGIPSIDITNSVICKVHGDYYNGTFSFSKVEKYALTNKERYTMLNDDSKPQMHKILENKKGLASAFRVPALSEGALKYFSVMTRIQGAPGALTCYAIEESKLSSIKNLDLEEVGEEKGILAKSKPISSLSSSSTTLTELKFDFSDPITQKLPILKTGRYCFVLVAETGSATDFWEIQFSNSASNSLDPDVQTNNVSYDYKQGTGFKENQSLGDMIFILSTIEVKANSESPRTEGLYSSEKVSVSNNSSLARARLTMRINREGIFTSESKGIVNDEGVIKVKTSGINPDDLGIKGGDTLIIGNNIRKAFGDCNFKNLAIDKAVSVEENDPIYRVGYKVYLRAVKSEWITGANARYEVTSDICLPMELKAVMQDRHKLATGHSDRLVFETEFRDEKGLPIDANEFYLQIVWKSNLKQSEIISNADYTGRIHDLHLSFDRTL